ncbi:MAG: hypothetical protein K8T91_21435 [Planctomycetes bacterium]|nr:hypothetical protein [Planctomycetota bacterium]
MMRVSPAQARILVEVLGHVDALYIPVRRQRADSPSTAAAVEERRSAYRSAGLLFVGDGTAEHREARTALVIAGAIVSTVSPQGPRLRLMPPGEQLVRELACTATIATAWRLLPLIDDIAAGDQYAREDEILGLPHAHLLTRQIATLENAALPLLVGGLLLSGSDDTGRVGYRLTAAGKVAIASGRPSFAQGYSANKRLVGLYNRVFQEQLEARERWWPQRRTQIEPLSAGCWGPASLSLRRSHIRNAFLAELWPGGLA